MEKTLSFRRIVNKAHLWVGLPSALVLFVVCLSGTIHVFNKEITRWLDSDRFYVTKGEKQLPASMLVTMVEEKNPEMKLTAITVPAASDEAWLFSLGGRKDKREPESSVRMQKVPQKKRTREKLTHLLVDPYTGRIQGNAQTPSSRFFATVLELHRWLLLEHDIGSVITGVAAFLFLFLELTGLVLWLPHKIKSWKNWYVWKPGFRIKTSAHWKRINYDIHRAAGFYTFFIITIMALTGPIFGFEWYKKSFNRALGVAPSRPVPATITAIPSGMLSVDEWLQKGRAIYPYAGDLRITFPKDGSSPVSFIKSRTSFFISAGTDRLALNPYTNATINDERFEQKSFAEKISSLVKAIHTGEVFGTFSKMLYFAACLIATSLPVTGILIWNNKRRKKKNRL